MIRGKVIYVESGKGFTIACPHRYDDATSIYSDAIFVWYRNTPPHLGATITVRWYGSTAKIQYGKE